MQGPQKITQIGNFGLKMNHLATLPETVFVLLYLFYLRECFSKFHLFLDIFNKNRENLLKIELFFRQEKLQIFLFTMNFMEIIKFKKMKSGMF
jgi:uncharacterized membrane protein YbaN (DUF454 family)